MRARTFESFSERNYALFYAGQIVSLTGSWIEKPALQSLAFRLTHQNEDWISWIGIIPLLPTLLVSLPAGAFADRRDPRRIVVWTQTLMMAGAAAMALLVHFGHCTIWHIAAYTVWSSGVFAVDAAARQSLVVHLVPRERLANAVALNASMFSVGRFAGAAVYAALIAWTPLDDGGCIALNAVSFAFVIAGLLMMRIAIRPQPERQHGADALEGLRYAWRTPVVRATLLMICVLSMFGFQVSHLFVVYSDKVWHMENRGLGPLHAAVGVGAVVGSLALATRTRSVHRGELMLAYALVATVCLAAFASVPPFGGALAILACGSFVLQQTQSAGNSLIQSTVPDELRGRVMALYTTGVLASFPIGGFLAGFAAKRFGAPKTTMADAVIILAAVAVIAVTHPSLRRAR